jgi:hypothetical protein
VRDKASRKKRGTRKPRRAHLTCEPEPAAPFTIQSLVAKAGVQKPCSYMNKHGGGLVGCDSCEKVFSIGNAKDAKAHLDGECMREMLEE